jgi:ubiquinone/menaquinone biosynthesis C-methylase UbiE/acyl carrier protein
MNGSYQLQNFTKNKEIEVTRLKAQVELFFEKEFDLYKRIGLKDGMDIIECGSGPGYLIKNILDRFPGCKATALEIDPFLFSVLTENSQSNGKKLFNPVNGSIYETKLPDNSFDFVLTRLVIEHLEEPLKAFYELNRIIKPGGKLVIVSNDFAYHLMTYPVIPELDEMYDAYCRSRFSEGGNPMIGRQLPVYLENSNFDKINFEIVTAHSKISGDETFLKAENVNISKSLVDAGFLNRNTLANLVEKWFEMLKDPFHVFYRQLMVVSGEKTIKESLKVYSGSLEDCLKGKINKVIPDKLLSKLDQQREKFKNLLNKYQQPSPVNGSHPGSRTSSVTGSNTAGTQDLFLKSPGSKVQDINKVESILLTVWKDILNNNSLTKDDNYFDIGGNSVLIPEIVARLSNEYSIKIRILDIFDNTSIRQLSDYICKNNL